MLRLFFEQSRLRLIVLSSIGRLRLNSNPGPTFVDFQIRNDEHGILEALLCQGFVRAVQDRISLGAAFGRGMNRCLAGLADRLAARETKRQNSQPSTELKARGSGVMDEGAFLHCPLGRV